MKKLGLIIVLAFVLILSVVALTACPRYTYYDVTVQSPFPANLGLTEIRVLDGNTRLTGTTSIRENTQLTVEWDSGAVWVGEAFLYLNGIRNAYFASGESIAINSATTIQVRIIASDAQVAAWITTRIDSLPNPDAVSIANEAAIRAVENQFNALTDAQQNRVAEAVYDRLQEILSVLEQHILAPDLIANAAALINALNPTGATITEIGDVVAARAAFDVLTPVQLALIEATELQALTQRLVNSENRVIYLRSALIADELAYLRGLGLTVDYTIGADHLAANITGHIFANPFIGSIRVNDDGTIVRQGNAVAEWIFDGFCDEDSLEITEINFAGYVKEDIFFLINELMIHGFDISMDVANTASLNFSVYPEGVLSLFRDVIIITAGGYFNDEAINIEIRMYINEAMRLLSGAYDDADAYYDNIVINGTAFEVNSIREFWRTGNQQPIRLIITLGAMPANITSFTLHQGRVISNYTADGMRYTTWQNHQSFNATNQVQTVPLVATHVEYIYHIGHMWTVDLAVTWTVAQTHGAVVYINDYFKIAGGPTTLQQRAGHNSFFTTQSIGLSITAYEPPAELREGNFAFIDFYFLCNLTGRITGIHPQAFKALWIEALSLRYDDDSAAFNEEFAYYLAPANVFWSNAAGTQCPDSDMPFMIGGLIYELADAVMNRYMNMSFYVEDDTVILTQGDGWGVFDGHHVPLTGYVPTQITNEWSMTTPYRIMPFRGLGWEFETTPAFTISHHIHGAELYMQNALLDLIYCDYSEDFIIRGNFFDLGYYYVSFGELVFGELPPFMDPGIYELCSFFIFTDDIYNPYAGRFFSGFEGHQGTFAAFKAYLAAAILEEGYASTQAEAEILAQMFVDFYKGVSFEASLDFIFDDNYDYEVEVLIRAFGPFAHDDMRWFEYEITPTGDHMSPRLEHIYSDVFGYQVLMDGTDELLNLGDSRAFFLDDDAERVVVLYNIIGSLHFTPIYRRYMDEGGGGWGWGDPMESGIYVVTSVNILELGGVYGDQIISETATTFEVFAPLFAETIIDLYDDLFWLQDTVESFMYREGITDVLEGKNAWAAWAISNYENFKFIVYGNDVGMMLNCGRVIWGGGGTDYIPNSNYSWLNINIFGRLQDYHYSHFSQTWMARYFGEKFDFVRGIGHHDTGRGIDYRIIFERVDDFDCDECGFICRCCDVCDITPCECLVEPGRVRIHVPLLNPAFDGAYELWYDEAVPPAIWSFVYAQGIWPPSSDAEPDFVPFSIEWTVEGEGLRIINNVNSLRNLHLERVPGVYEGDVTITVRIIFGEPETYIEASTIIRLMPRPDDIPLYLENNVTGIAGFGFRLYFAAFDDFGWTFVPPAGQIMISHNVGQMRLIFAPTGIDNIPYGYRLEVRVNGRLQRVYFEPTPCCYDMCFGSCGNPEGPYRWITVFGINWEDCVFYGPAWDEVRISLDIVEDVLPCDVSVDIEVNFDIDTDAPDFGFYVYVSTVCGETGMNIWTRIDDIAGLEISYLSDIRIFFFGLDSIKQGYILEVVVEGEVVYLLEYWDYPYMSFVWIWVEWDEWDMVGIVFNLVSAPDGLSLAISVVE